MQTDITETLKTTGTKVCVYKRGMNIKDSKGNIISVSESGYAERSKHPVFSVNVSNETKSFIYTTSAFFEVKTDTQLPKADVLIVGTHGATVKEIFDRDFLSKRFESLPHTIVFSSPNEMLGNKDIVSYINYLYQNGHRIIIDGENYYKFELD